MKKVKQGKRWRLLLPRKRRKHVDQVSLLLQCKCSIHEVQKKINRLQVLIKRVTLIAKQKLHPKSSKRKNRATRKEGEVQGCEFGSVDWEGYLLGENMAEVEVEELVVQLEKNMDLSSMERGIKLVGKVLVDKNLNKWGVRNILRSSWKELGEVEIKWVKDNTFIITVKDESSAAQIANRTPWAVMKQNFSVKRWDQELALEEIDMNIVSFWIQIRGVPPYLHSEENAQRLASKIAVFEEFEDPGKARGFLRIKVAVNTLHPLITGCWLPRADENESWVEFSFEMLQDFCYKCGRIGHSNVECNFEPIKGGMAGYGEWTKEAPVWDFIETPKTPSH